MTTLAVQDSNDKIKYTLYLHENAAEFELMSLEDVSNNNYLINTMIEKLTSEEITHVKVVFGPTMYKWKKNRVGVMEKDYKKNYRTNKEINVTVNVTDDNITIVTCKIENFKKFYKQNLDLLARGKVHVNRKLPQDKEGFTTVVPKRKLKKIRNATNKFLNSITKKYTPKKKVVKENKEQEKKESVEKTETKEVKNSVSNN